MKVIFVRKSYVPFGKPYLLVRLLPNLGMLDVKLIGLRYKTNSYRILVGLSVRFDSYSYSYSSLDDRGRWFTDLGPYWLRREKSWEYPWPLVHRPLADPDGRRRGRDSGDILGGYRV